MKRRVVHNPRWTNFGRILGLLSFLCACAGLACSSSSRRGGSDGGDSEARKAAALAPPAAQSASAAPIDAVSGASPAWTGDAKPVITKGQVSGAALRAAHVQRLKQPEGRTVTVLGGGSPRELGARLCEAVVPKRNPDTKILLKPNIGGFEWFKDPKTNDGDDGLKGRITQPEFTRGVVQCLKARGHTRITIAEGWGATHADWERLVRVSGYEAMAKQEGVPLVAMDDDGVFDIEGTQPGKPLLVTGMDRTQMPKLLMPKILAEHLQDGLFLSLPKLKAHRFGVVSIGLKGMQGVVMTSDASPAFKQKWRSHRELGDALGKEKRKEPGAREAYVKSLEVFAERMIDVYEVATPDAILADGAPGMGGDGFGKQWPSQDMVAVGGTNAVYVDAVGAKLLGLYDNEALAAELGGHKTSPLIEAGAKRFGLDLGALQITGDAAGLLASPRPVHFVGMPGFELHADAAPSPAGISLPEAHAKRTDDAQMHIDGTATDGEWSSVTAAPWDTDYAGAATGIRTAARFAWSPSGLYALFDLSSAGLNTDTSRPTSVERTSLYQEDCVELFLTPDPKRKSFYYEIEVGPFGHYFDLSVDRDTKKSDTSWSSGLRVATTRDETSRTAHIELFIPSADVRRHFAPHARLPMGLFRMEGKAPRSYLAWSPPRTPKPNFHVPEAFGTLVLDP
jgi:uncharacterized protein (DUF362 family)